MGISASSQIPRSIVLGFGRDNPRPEELLKLYRGESPLCTVRLPKDASLPETHKVVQLGLNAASDN